MSRKRKVSNQLNTIQRTVLKPTKMLQQEWEFKAQRLRAQLEEAESQMETLAKQEDELIVAHPTYLSLLDEKLQLSGTFELPDGGWGWNWSQILFHANALKGVVVLSPKEELRWKYREEELEVKKHFKFDKASLPMHVDVEWDGYKFEDVETSSVDRYTLSELKKGVPHTLFFKTKEEYTSQQQPFYPLVSDYRKLDTEVACESWLESVPSKELPPLDHSDSNCSSGSINATAWLIRPIH